MEDFAKLCDKLENTSSSKEKISLIAKTINKLEEKELYLMCMYLTGGLFPASNDKNIYVGNALIRDGVLNLISKEKNIWSDTFRKFGDIGVTTEFLLANDKSENSLLDSYGSNKEIGQKTLNHLEKFLLKLTKTSGNLDKVVLIKDFLGLLTPFQAKYFTKLILGKLRMGVQTATVESAIAEAFGENLQKVREINFYLGDIGEVAQKVKNRNYENISFKLFHPIKAMLASAEVEIEEIFKRFGKTIWCEYKYDGMRAHIHYSIEEDKIKIFTRDLKDITAQFPEVVDQIKTLALKNKHIQSFLIDGEIVAYKSGIIQPFAFLQKRLGRKEKVEEEAKTNPCFFIGYDILYSNGELVIDKNLTDRRSILEDMFVGMTFSTKQEVSNKKDFMDFFRQVKQDKIEGIMVKNPVSRYEPGKRGINWLKYKQTLEPLDVVVLKAEYGEGRNSKYLSNLTIGVLNDQYASDTVANPNNVTTSPELPKQDTEQKDKQKRNKLQKHSTEDSQYVYIGRVYSGLKEDDLVYLTKKFKELATAQTENGYLLEPKVILEIAFENIQKSNRYDSGYAVRFPRVLRNRTEDKPLDEISKISDLEKYFF